MSRSEWKFLKTIPAKADDGRIYPLDMSVEYHISQNSSGIHRVAGNYRLQSTGGHEAFIVDPSNGRFSMTVGGDEIGLTVDQADLTY